MRLAKGFFLPVFVAQIGDLPLPCTIGAASERHRTQVLPSLFGEEKSLFRLLSAFFDQLKSFFKRIFKKNDKILIFEKNMIFQFFSKILLKNVRKMKKIKKIFPRPSGSLSARRTHLIPGCD